MGIINKFKRIFFPEVCPFCDDIIPLHRDECTCLRDAYYISDDFCNHCGSNKSKCSCGNTTSVYLEDICGVYVYSGRARKALHRLKFEGNKNIASRLGDKMSLRIAKCYPEVSFELVCCVPMHREDRKHRGYNQSELLAKQVAKRLFIPFEDCLVKNKRTKMQHTLNADERNINLIGCIEIKDGFDVRNKTILLCDDIKTTGSTLFECQKALTDAGAKRVVCLCCAVSDFSLKRKNLSRLDKRNKSR